MPGKPTLVDFFNFRFAPATHVLQSATDAMKKGQKEEIILMCLLHDVVINLIKVDHGWWGAMMLEPYVSEKVSWAIRYHQALRFFPDPSVGYEYPEMYNRIFGKDYVPPPYIKQAYEYARNHKSYMDARMITVHDLYAFDPTMKVSRSIHRDHESTLQTAEGRARVRQQPGRAHVADTHLSGQSSLIPALGHRVSREDAQVEPLLYPDGRVQ